MNWYLTLAAFFTFLFFIHSMRCVCHVIRDGKGFGNIKDYFPFICAIIASIFWGLI